MDELLSQDLLDLRSEVREIARTDVAPHAARVDQECEWPTESMAALADAGLMGLHVAPRLGGRGLGLFALSVACEELARVCPSTAMCFGMHCVGTAVIAAKVTKDQEERYLRPIAAGRHLTTLALSEPGTGVHFYLPQCKLVLHGDEYSVNGKKHFVTNGSHADSYVVSTQATSGHSEEGEFSCLIVDRDQPGMHWKEPWRGFGMRGNSSLGLELADVRVGAENLLGQEGDEIWYAFEVVAPYFLVAMAGTYVGVAQEAFTLTQDHMRTRRFEVAGTSLADVPVLQSKLAEMWSAVTKTRSLVYHACRLGDVGDPEALVAILACKADAGDTAVQVTNEAMTVCGGIAYRENGRLSQLLREARASHVMAPTTTVLKEWAGKTLLDLPLL